MFIYLCMILGTFKDQSFGTLREEFLGKSRGTLLAGFWRICIRATTEYRATFEAALLKQLGGLLVKKELT